jgi:predicted regulator of Ras-like GTPase activity (Roadblock/LC7/MglB family)
VSLGRALESVQGLSGLVAAVVLTLDGLPIEQVGDGFATELLAAELAGIGEKARQGMSNLALGDVSQLWLTVQAFQVALIVLPDCYLALVFDAGKMISPFPSMERVLQPLRAALGGDWHGTEAPFAANT